MCLMRGWDKVAAGSTVQPSSAYLPINTASCVRPDMVTQANPAKRLGVRTGANIIIHEREKESLRENPGRNQNKFVELCTGITLPHTAKGLCLSNS